MCSYHSNFVLILSVIAGKREVCLKFERVKRVINSKLKITLLELFSCGFERTCSD